MLIVAFMPNRIKPWFVVLFYDLSKWYLAPGIEFDERVKRWPGKRMYLWSMGVPLVYNAIVM